MNDTSVRFLTPAATIRVRTQHEAGFMARHLYFLGAGFVKQCFESGASTGPVSKVIEVIIIG